MSEKPLAEVFGFPSDNFSEQAMRFRKNSICPYGNKVPNCTKDKANDPLGVCSIHHGEDVVITCPVRFREGWVIAEDAASFFFPEGTRWTTLTEVRLKDKDGQSAGNIDVVLCAYDEDGTVTDFGALEVQAVYISGNVRVPFREYMKTSKAGQNVYMDSRKCPRPDYLSSSRKRLAPQLIFKGGILKSWNKKVAVALNKGFFETLPNLEEVQKDEADIAWFVYDLKMNHEKNVYELARYKVKYTKFSESLKKITQSEPGDINSFLKVLQAKVDKELDGNPPDTETINAPF